MSPTVVIKCPTCATQMKVNRPQGAFQVVCRKCGQQIRVSAASVAPPPSSTFDDLPAPIAPPAPAARPKTVKRPAKPKTVQRTAATPSAAAKSRRAGKKRDFKTPLIALASLAITAAIGVGVYFAWDKLPIESMASIVPMMDSPEKILKDYVDIAEDLATTVDSIQGTESRDAAVPKIEQLTERCRGLSRRAVAVGPLSSEKLKSLGEWFKTQIPNRSKRVKDSAERVNQKRELATDELRLALFDVSFALGDVGGTMQNAWQEIPSPQDEKQQIEYEITMVHHRVWGAVASVANESDYAKLAAVYDSAGAELESILTKNREILAAEGTLGVSSPYFSNNVSYSVDTSMKLGNHQQKYGPHSDSAAFKRYSDAKSAIKSAGDEVGMSSLAGPAFGPGSPRGPNRLGMRDETGRPIAGGSGPPFRGGRPPGFGPRSPDEQFENRIRIFRERQPPDKAVVIRVSATDQKSCMAAIQDMCLQDLKQRWRSISFVGDGGLALLTYDGPLSDVIEHIDWGTVTSSDTSTRTIHVQQNPSAASQ